MNIILYEISGSLHVGGRDSVMPRLVNTFSFGQSWHIGEFAPQQCLRSGIGPPFGFLNQSSYLTYICPSFQFAAEVQHNSCPNTLYWALYIFLACNTVNTKRPLVIKPVCSSSSVGDPQANIFRRVLQRDSDMETGCGRRQRY